MACLPRRNDYNVIKQYELRVDQAEVGDLSEGEKRLDWITFTNFVGTLSDIARGDVLTRVDSVTDLTRKGIVKVTTIDEIGAPYIDVVYGMKTDPENATKARMGNLTGIRTKSGIDLTGIWGIYGNGAYFENSTYILEDGNTIEQKFSIMNGEFVYANGDFIPEKFRYKIITIKKQKVYGSEKHQGARADVLPELHRQVGLHAGRPLDPPQPPPVGRAPRRGLSQGATAPHAPASQPGVPVFGGAVRGGHLLFEQFLLDCSFLGKITADRFADKGG